MRPSGFVGEATPSQICNWMKLSREWVLQLREGGPPGEAILDNGPGFTCLRSRTPPKGTEDQVCLVLVLRSIPSQLSWPPAGTTVMVNGMFASKTTFC